MEVLKIDKYDGYEVRHEKFIGDEAGLPAGEAVVLVSAYTPEGLLIDDPEVASYLINILGIKPELRCAEANVCTIGYTAQGQRWYGWSHRWITSFGVGDMLFDPTVGDETTPLAQRGVIEIETLEQAREAASRFAEYVS